MTIKEKDLRVAIVGASKACDAAQLNVGTAGNVSARLGARMLITPSGVPCDLMRPEMVAAMPVIGEYGAWKGPLKPSTEWRFHLDIMRARPDVGAIVHFHPTFCAALAMLHKPILAAHYMIALFGGPSVRCTKYAPYGTKELADLVVEGLGAGIIFYRGSRRCDRLAGRLQFSMGLGFRLRRGESSIIKIHRA